MGPRSNKSSLGLKSLIYFDSDVRHCSAWTSMYEVILFLLSFPVIKVRYGWWEYKYSTIVQIFNQNIRFVHLTLKRLSPGHFLRVFVPFETIALLESVLRKFLGHCDLKSFSDTYNPTSLFPSLSSNGFLLHWNESIQLIKFLYSGIKTSERLPPLSILVHLRELTKKMDFFYLNLGIKNPRLRAAKNRNDSTSPIFPNGIRDCWSTMTCCA